MELVGRLPSNTLNGTTCSGSPDLYLIAIFLLNHFAGFTKRQRFGLGKEVRQQLRMVVGQRVVGNRRGDKVARHHFGPPVNQLVERVLTVGTRLAPDDWARLVIHGVAVTVNVFTVDSMLPCWK